MSRKNGFIGLAVLCSLCLVLGFQGPALAKTVKIKMSSPFPAADERSQAYTYWADLVKERTGGRIEATLFPGGSLMPLGQHFVAMSQGSLDMGFLVSAYIDKSVPELVILSVGTAFPPDPEGIIKTQRAIAPVMRKILKKHNIMYLFGTYEGESVIMTRKALGPVERLAQVKGMKLRDFGPWTGEVVRRLGGAPTTLPIGELNLALQRGTVDGAYFYWLTAEALKLGEVAPYLLYLGVSASWVFSGMNLDLFNSLSKEDQKILLEAAEEATAHSSKLGAKRRAIFFDPEKNKDFQIRYMSDEDKVLLQKTCSEIRADVDAKLPPLGKELSETLRTIK